MGWRSLTVDRCFHVLTPIWKQPFGRPWLQQEQVENVSGDVVDGRHRDTPSNLATVRPYMKTAGQALVQDGRIWLQLDPGYKASKTPVRWSET